MHNLNYGVIGNCRTAALISDKGSIDWFCFPDFDSPSIFSKILDEEKGGSFSILVSAEYKIRQEYKRSTNILSTRYTSDEGSFEVIDFMPRYKTTEQEYYLSPEIYRYIRLLNGAPKFRILYQPRFNYALSEADHLTFADYIVSFSKDNTDDYIYLYSSLEFSSILSSDEITLTGNQFLLLSYYQKLIDIDIDRVYLEYQRTKIYWLNWSNRSKKFNLYNDQINRSLLILKLMSFQPSGAVLAAITTSLPETIGEVRNWDYRFCWLRDASMSIETLLEMGHKGAAQGFLAFIKRILKSKYDKFQIMYGIRGERTLIEEELSHLAGHENSRPVRIGNAAYYQKQNDVFGYLMNVIYQYYVYFPGTLDEIEEMWAIVRNIVRNVVRDWHQPDNGIWEIRGQAKHFVFSKVMSWVAVDRGIKIAHLLHRPEMAENWTEIADQIKDEIWTNGWDPFIESFTQTYNEPDLDAALLLMEEYGFIDAEDPRFHKTVSAIKNELFYKGLMYRYKNEDDFGRTSSAFTICTFWLVHALYRIGETEEAQLIFENLLSYSNHLGLFSEDLDFETKRQLGNFPQAYSHLALINTAKLFTSQKHLSQFIKP